MVSLLALLARARFHACAGIVGGGAFEYARSAYSNPEKVRIRRFRTAYDVSRRFR